MAGIGNKFIQNMRNTEYGKWSSFGRGFGMGIDGKGTLSEMSDDLMQLKNTLKIGFSMGSGWKKNNRPEKEAEAVVPDDEEQDLEEIPEETGQAAKSAAVFVNSTDKKAPEREAAGFPEGFGIAEGAVQDPAERMRQAMLWSEILGEPVSVKRRKKRVERAYGNQGHARRG